MPVHMQYSISHDQVEIMMKTRAPRRRKVERVVDHFVVEVAPVPRVNCPIRTAAQPAPRKASFSALHHLGRGKGALQSHLCCVAHVVRAVGVRGLHEV